MGRSPWTPGGFFLVASAVIAGPGPIDTTPSVPHIVPLWRDTTRTEQLIRLGALQLQTERELGAEAWELAHLAWRNLPKWARIDLPSHRVFAAILGLFRTGATLKKRKILLIELSVQQIAKLLKYSKSTVEAALRWLASGPIEHHGQQVTRGLGLIHRARRTGLAFLEGELRRVYRTSKLGLSVFGRLLLGLVDRDEERKQEKAKEHAENKKPKAPQAPTSQPTHQSEQKPAVAEEAAAVTEVGRSWIKRILGSL